MTPEGKVKAKVKKALLQLGTDCWRFMPVQTGYGAPALDFLLSVRGRFVAIETKAPGKKLTPQQESTKADIEAAGGIVLIVWDEDTLAIALKIILALEFAPNVGKSDDVVRLACLDAIRRNPRQRFNGINVRTPEAQRDYEEHERAKLAAQTSD